MTGDMEKQEAARKAVARIKKGMAVGLGTGSTAVHFIRMLGERERAEKLGLKCIATSISSEKLARECGLRVVGFDEIDCIDVAVDGADVIVGQKLIKGLGGGAITREKAVDYRAKEFIVIADSTKVKKLFGGIVPIEAIPFASEAVKRELVRMGAERVADRMKGNEKLITDNGNYILDAVFPRIKNPKRMERELKLIPGVVESGIFTKKCKIIVGGI